MPRIADALLLRFTRGVSLCEWARTGLLGREMALYEALTQDFGRIVFITDGDDRDIALASSMGLTIICNEARLSAEAYDLALPELVAERSRDLRTIVVKTNQLAGGASAVRITRALREHGARVGLVARGGYLHSKFVAEEHGPDSETARRAGAEERELCLSADFVVGSSPTMLADLAWRHCLPSSRVVLQPNFILDANPAYASSEREPYELLYAGQFVRRKRVDLLIEALSKLPQSQRRKTRLTLIGDGPQKHALQQLATRLSVDVRFEPRMPHADLLARMRQCAIFLCASELEGHPKAVLEAMGSGAPVVVADSPGLGEVVEHGVTGLRVPPSPETFARTVEVLLEDEELRRSIGRAGAELVASRFNLRRTLEIERQTLRSAARSAGVSALGADTVSWEPGLDRQSARAQIDAWSNAISRFAETLDPEARATLLLGLDSPLHELQRRAASKLRATSIVANDTAFVREAVIDEPGPIVAGDPPVAVRLASTIPGARLIPYGGSSREREDLRREAARIGLPQPEIFDEPICQSAEGSTLIVTGAIERARDRSGSLAALMARVNPARILLRVPACDRDWRVTVQRELGVEWRSDASHRVEFTQQLLTSELLACGLTISKITRVGDAWWADAVPTQAGEYAAPAEQAPPESAGRSEAA